MSSTSTIYPLLESVIKDHRTFKFPIKFIHKELLAAFMQPFEFDYFMTMCFKKLKSEYGYTVGHIFLQVMEIKLKTANRDIYSLTESEYHTEMENFISSLENIYITKIDKDSPDGELLSAMI